MAWPSPAVPGVPHDLVLPVWAGPSEPGRLASELSRFAGRLAEMPAFEKVRPLGEEEIAGLQAVATGRRAAG